MTLRRGLAALAAVTAACAVPAAPAHADDVSLDRLRELAASARDDPAAREELRAVDSVDGTPVDLGLLLEGDQSAVDERLETLADGAPAHVDAASARDEAGDILSERRFRGTDTPRPLRGLLDWIADRIRLLGDAFDWLADKLPGRDSTAAVLLASLVLAGAALAAWRVATRRSRRMVEEQRRTDARLRVDPRDLERAADEAEQAGKLEDALRLRFRAGLIRLERARVIPDHESLTSGEVSRHLRSSEFDRIALTFDEVVYGRRAASPPDVKAARVGWPRVLQQAGAR